MQKARRHSCELRPLVSEWFQLSFTRLVAVVFIVQSPYLFTIGYRGVFSLGGWTPHVQTGFPEPDFTRGLADFRLQDFHLLRCTIPGASLVRRLIRFRSPLLTESLLLSFPLGTEMFHFPRFALYPYAFRVQYPYGWVAPFGNPKVNAYLPARLGLSQVDASFIASRHQDIHRAPFHLITPT